MKSTIENDAAFLRSLNHAQRTWFLQRERDHADRLQAALRSVASGMSDISALHGASLALLLDSRA